MATRGLHIVFLYADTPQELNCSVWRALIPSDAINAAHEAGLTPNTGKLYYLPTALDWNHPKIQKEVGLGDIIVFQRNVIVPQVWDTMDYWRALGRTVIVDLDDHYPMIPPSNPAFDYWIKNVHQMQPNPVDCLAEGLKHADALTSPGKAILRDWAHVVPGYWIPNWTQWKWYEGLKQKPIGAVDYLLDYKLEKDKPPELYSTERPDSAGDIVLGWGGSISHVDSWVYSGIIGALERLFEKYPRLKLKFCGGETRLDYIFNRFGDRMIRQTGLKAEHWPQVISTFDIGLAPLDLRKIDPYGPDSPDNAYDERRSWLKGAEYLTAGVPWVGSKSLTYEDLARWGTLVENTPEAWEAALDYKIQNLKNEKEKAWHNRRWAERKMTLQGNVNTLNDIYGRIVADAGARKGVRLPGIVYVEPKGEKTDGKPA